MSSDVQREEWMTKELEQKLIDISKENSLTCTEIQKFASENGIDIQAIPEVPLNVSLPLWH